MRNPILMGEAQILPRLSVGTVWLDIHGKIAVVVGETPDAFLLQTADHVIEIVPAIARNLFESTVSCLGEL